MDATERAVGEESHGVTRLGLLDDRGEDGIDARRGDGLVAADLAREPLEIEPLALGHVGAPERREEHAIGGGERGDVLVLVERTARGGAARLEDRPQLAARVASAVREVATPTPKPSAHAAMAPTALRTLWAPGTLSAKRPQNEPPA